MRTGAYNDKNGRGSNGQGQEVYDPERSFLAPRAEIGVLASIMIQPDLMGEVREMLEPDDFAGPNCQSIYQEICQLWDERVPATLTMLMSRMPNDADNIMTIVQKASEDIGSSPGYAIYNARMVADYAERRRYAKAAIAGLSQLTDMSVKTQDIIGALPGKILRGSTDGNSESLGTLAPSVFENIDAERSGRLVSRATPTGFADLDRILLGGSEPGELLTLAARSSVGKTMFAQSLLLNATTFGTAVFFSAEMKREQIMRRLISTVSGIPLAKIRSRATSEEEHALVRQASEELAEIPLIIDDTSGITTTQMLQRVQRLQAEHEVSIVILDYLELIGDGKKEGKKTYDRLSDAVVSLKNAAMMAEVPVWVLSQVSRDVEKRGNRVPNTTDLRQTGMLEQTSDKIVALYRHDHYVSLGIAEPDESRQGKLEAHVIKNRSGPVGKVDLGFDSETGQIYNLDQAGARVYDQPI